MKSRTGPLSGLRILEIGHYVAAPFAGRILADLGAEVVKVEHPGVGDPARYWGALWENRSIWWSVHARNKRSMTLDLKKPEGRDLLLKLAEKSDAVLENFRPGQLERWGLGPEELARANPDCITVRISGYGQNGPYRNKPAFGLIGEAMGGIRYLTGYPNAAADMPPIRTGVSLGDSLAGLYGVIGVLAGLYSRGKRANRSAQVVDVALYESVFSLMEGSLPEYGLLGKVRQPSGSALPTAAPSNSYLTSDRFWICIAANSDPILARLAMLIGRPDIPADPRFVTNDARVANAAALDAIIAEWVGGRTVREVEDQLEGADVPCCRIYSIADCAADPHFIDRGMVQTVDDPSLGGKVLHPGIVPRFEGQDTCDIQPGPALGADTDAILRKLVGLSEAEISRLRGMEVV
ncbi:MAG: CoA transferase [Rhizobiaceae bacterium]|nr:CoA transferase [Rhizobiaceae bacterium]